MKRVLLMLVIAGFVVAGAGCKRTEKTAKPAKTVVIKKARAPRAPRKVKIAKTAEKVKTAAIPVAVKV